MLHEFSFSSFPSLAKIDLFNNSLYGTIPSQTANLSKLTYLDLSTNQFSEEIPPEIYLLTNLRVLHIVEKQLKGLIPNDIGHLRYLEELACITTVYIFVYLQQFTFRFHSSRISK
ncbi:hypothetical protein Ddye_027231 [Dipteronia dyeriana]|uniref:Non-specific serine/threonine protein kinase n=1 Tax=Dipteronia dyeriana TaxID=168575 RepID=A0AAD9WQA3_9ROSI|nr:hypothetical protein Ddye_027231 [Dipteronia dyeriana]